VLNNDECYEFFDVTVDPKSDIEEVNETNNIARLF